MSAIPAPTVQAARFRVSPIPARLAERVLASRDDGHGNTGLRPLRATDPTGFPCRVCLREAATGDELLLFSYSPFERPMPYRSVGPVFVHARGCTPFDPASGVPALLRRRLLSVRSYDARHRLLDCDVAKGADLEELVERLFADPRAAYAHVHNAGAGCYLCLLERD